MAVFEIFPTFVFANDVPACEPMNKAMLASIKEHQSRDAGPSKSSWNGWHSPETNDLALEPSFEPFHSLLKGALKEVVDFMGYKDVRIGLMNMWSIVSPKGACNTRHNHPRSIFSGVYYVQADEKSSTLILHDPRTTRVFSEPFNPNVNEIAPRLLEIATITPKAGRLIIFPGWLDHSVPPNESETERVVVSFNFGVVPTSQG